MVDMIVSLGIPVRRVARTPWHRCPAPTKRIGRRVPRTYRNRGIGANPVAHNAQLNLSGTTAIAGQAQGARLISTAQAPRDPSFFLRTTGRSDMRRRIVGEAAPGRLACSSGLVRRSLPPRRSTHEVRRREGRLDAANPDASAPHSRGAARGRDAAALSPRLEVRAGPRI